MKHFVYSCSFIVMTLLGSTTQLWSQQELSLDNYIKLVKLHHPFVKQAQLQVAESDAKLMQKRGAFDPKLIYNKKEKTFKGTPYYENQKTQLVVPTLYGVALEAQMQQASGAFLNPENTTSGEQLFGLGASIELGRGILSNPRQTALKQAKLFTQQAREENALTVNSILTTAGHAYLDWYKAYRSYQIFDQFVANAAFRFEGVKKRMESGDLAAIDSTEARIAYNQRRLERENAHLNYRKKTLEVSNFIWLDNQPMELGDEVQPRFDAEQFLVRFTPDSLPLENHPKLRALAFKRNRLVLEKRLQRANLLPQISLQYQWLSNNSPIAQLNYALDPDNSTTGIKAAFPLFLRKERANLKLATLKTTDVEWEQAQTRLRLQNKIQALYVAKERLKKQERLAQEMVADYQLLFEGEQKKFAAGESSLFLVNTRESRLISALLKAVELSVAQKKATLDYYYALQFPALETTQ